jgi:hypothetical protein
MEAFGRFKAALQRLPNTTVIISLLAFYDISGILEM